MRTNHATVIFLAVGLLLGTVGRAAAGAPRVDIATLWLQGEDITQQEQAPAASADRELRVQVWHDKDDEAVYQRGEPLRVHFRTDSDAYVVVYRIDADGLTEVLWPTTRYNDGFVYGGHTYTLPPQGAPERLRTSLSKGVEYVEAIASRYPFDLRNLAIDFTFDRDAQERYDHTVAGDPFLAVNDINYAITGLEEDVDYVVTDWAHIYVDERVDYARYTCNQCHNGDGHDVHPYVDHCTQVAVYYDWGWYDSWYDRYGWWPVYYDPLYWYWDVSLYRAWYFPYYRVCYRWPGYGWYARPYPVWNWWDSPNCRGDYWALYDRGTVRQRPLYAAGQPPSENRFGSGNVPRTRGDDPPSIVRARSTQQGRGDRTRTAPADLARRTPPVRSRGELLERPRTAIDRPGRDGSGRVRTDVARADRVVRSLPAPGNAGGGGATGTAPTRIAPQGRDVERSDRGARRWTQPVIRNADPDRQGRGRSAPPDRLVSPPPSQQRGRGVGRDRSSTVAPRQEPAPRGGDAGGRSARQPGVRSGNDGRDRDNGPPPAARPSPREQGSSSRRTPAPSSSHVTPPRSSPPPAPQVAPPRPAPAPRQAPAPRGGDSRGGGGGRSGQASRGTATRGGDSRGHATRGGTTP